MKRRLAAILQADLVGFSRLVALDENATHDRLVELRKNLIEPLVADHRGRIVKTLGDGFLCEFSSVVDASECALAWQAGVAQHEKDQPDDERFSFRIGIALGDIIIDDEDVFGDGVNLAARLEALADSGGILITEDGYRQVHGKVGAEFEDLGPQMLKNMSTPVTVYRLLAPGLGKSPWMRGERRPQRPSIVVLPFVNRSGDLDQDYFVDGITEEIITALSRVRWFFIIARSTSFTYRDRNVDASRVAADLGVRYVLEGSVRRSNGEVRVTAELIDGTTGRQLWANRYDRSMEDIFGLQDDIAESLIGAIEPEMSRAERDLARRKRPENLDAWDVYQRGMAHLYQLTPDALTTARELFQQAIEMDPSLVPAYSGLAETYYHEVVYGFSSSRETDRNRALAPARRAVALDPDDPSAHGTLGRIHYLRGEHDAAVLELESALELNPSYALAHYSLGAALLFSGHAEEAKPHLELAIRLSPRDASMGSFLVRLAEVNLMMGQASEAERLARRALQQPQFQWSRYAALLASLGVLGRAEEAASRMQEMLQERPDFSVDFVRTHHLYTDPGYLDKYLQALRLAGVPEGPN